MFFYVSFNTLQYFALSFFQSAPKSIPEHSHCGSNYGKYKTNLESVKGHTQESQEKNDDLCIFLFIHIFSTVCTLYSMPCIQEETLLIVCRNHLLHTVYCILYSVYCILYSVYCILYSVYCILYTVYCIVYTVYCIYSSI